MLGFAFQNSLEIFLYAFVSNVLASYFSGRCENRNIILRAGVYTSLVMVFLTVLFDVFLGHGLKDVPIRFVFLLASGVASSFIALGILLLSRVSLTTRQT